MTLEASNVIVATSADTAFRITPLQEEWHKLGSLGIICPPLVLTFISSCSFGILETKSDDTMHSTMNNPLNKVQMFWFNEIK